MRGGVDLTGRRSAFWLAELCVIAALYFIETRIGLALSFKSLDASPVWSAADLAFVALFLRGLRVWPAVTLGTFVSCLFMFVPHGLPAGRLIAVAAAVALGNTLEVIAGVAAFRRLSSSPHPLGKVQDVAAFVVFTAFLSTAFGAAAGSCAVSAAGLTPWSEFWEVWFTWWTGNAMRVLIVVPFVLVWLTGGFRLSQPKRLVEAVLVLLALGILSVYVFRADPNISANIGNHLPYLTFPVIVWAAWRFGARGAASAVLLASLVAGWYAIRGAGPYTLQSPRAALLSLELYQAVLCVTAFAFAAVLTERRRAEEASAHLAAAVRQASEGMIISSPEGVIQYVNPAFEQISGFPSGACVGKTLDAVRNTGGPPLLSEEVLRSVRSGSPWKGRDVSRTKSGMPYHAELSVSCVRGPDAAPSNLVAMIRDVTHETDLENRLLHTQKMEAIGTLAGGIAHDFNNILAIILGFAEQAVHQVPADGLAALCLRRILKAGHRGSELVKQILTFSHHAEQDREVLALVPLVAEAVKLFRGSLAPGITIQERYDLECSPILADPARVHQIVMNLCSNACHAMRDGGGVLSVSVSEVALPEEGPDTPARAHDGTYVRLRVQDTGEGMDESVQRRIFDPFFTTKRHGEGTGLGLAIVHGIVKAGGGIIRTTSAPGQGSIFDVLLPVCDATMLAAAEPDSPVANPVSGSEHILFVDDEEALAEVVRYGLESFGYRVTTFTGAQQAIDAFRGAPGRFDLVLTDLMMPNVNGIQLAQTVSRLNTGIPILACTGNFESLDREQLRAAGILDVIKKPFSNQELASAIRRSLDA